MTSIWYALMWKIVLLLRSEPYLCVYLLSFSVWSLVQNRRLPFKISRIAHQHCDEERPAISRFCFYFIHPFGFLLSQGCIYKTKLMHSKMHATQTENETVYVMLLGQFVLRRKNSKATNTSESVFTQSCNDLFYQRLLTKNYLPETDRNQIDCKRKKKSYFSSFFYWAMQLLKFALYHHSHHITLIWWDSLMGNYSFCSHQMQRGYTSHIRSVILFKY